MDSILKGKGFACIGALCRGTAMLMYLAVGQSLLCTGALPSTTAGGYCNNYRHGWLWWKRIQCKSSGCSLAWIWRSNRHGHRYSGEEYDQISALETQGNARTLSSPKVVVLDNKEAYIKTGTGILLPTLPTTAGVTITYTEQEALLQLKVTLRVINDDQIYLKILTSRDSFDFSRSV